MMDSDALYLGPIWGRCNREQEARMKEVSCLLLLLHQLLLLLVLVVLIFNNVHVSFSG